MQNNIFFNTDLTVIPDALTPDILFSDFYQIYYSDMVGRLKPTSLAIKNAIIQDKVLPVFGGFSMNEISPQFIRRWQTDLLSQGYSDTYLKTIDMHLFSVFKYAFQYYDFPNPYDKAEHIGTSNTHPMNFWTLQEYHSFIQSFDVKSAEFIAFELLYWCGMRVGELLALTPQDIDRKKIIIKISKTYTRHYGQDYISTPKTPNSVRSISVPQFLFKEVMDYISENDIKKNERLIPHTVAFLTYHLSVGCERSGVHQIRIHDIRHSHVSLLINQGFSAIAIAKRVGHKHISTTMNVYAHLFPNRQERLVQALEDIHDGRFHGKEVSYDNK